MSKMLAPYHSLSRHIETMAGAIADGARDDSGATRSGKMRNFLDRTGNLWQEGKLVGKIGSIFASTATQHGGQETTITSFHTFLFHQGMTVVGVPYICQELMNMGEISGGTPYGATTLSKGDGSRPPGANELAIARFQGWQVAEITQKLGV